MPVCPWTGSYYLFRQHELSYVQAITTGYLPVRYGDKLETNSVAWDFIEEEEAELGDD